MRIIFKFQDISQLSTHDDETAEREVAFPSHQLVVMLMTRVPKYQR